MAQRSNRAARFQFSLRTLLLLPVLFAGAWWWVTWPEQTRRAFVRMIDEGRKEQASKMIAWEDWNEMGHDDREVRDMLVKVINSKSRSWEDVVVGRRVYVQHISYGFDRCVTVERGTIKPGPSFYYAPAPDDPGHEVPRESARE